MSGRALTERHAESRVFRRWRIDSLAVPEGARPYYGADWGFAADPTVLVRCYLFDGTLYIDREAYRVGCPISRSAEHCCARSRERMVRGPGPSRATAPDRN